MTRAGKRRSKFFADIKFGGKKKSMAQAVVYRDALVKSRPEPATRAAPKPLLVVRGEARYLQIRVPTRDGTTTTEFSIKRHGAREARRLAIAAYNAAAKRKK